MEQIYKYQREGERTRLTKEHTSMDICITYGHTQ